MSEETPRHRYRLTYSIEGRARFLSHLETIDTLLSALRRSGVRLALSNGMKPKPVIALALPRPVAVEAWHDIAEVELAEAIDTDVFALQLTAQLPAGISLIAIDELAAGERGAARRVAGTLYRLELTGISEADLATAVDTWHSADELLVHRKTPKQDRMINVRHHVAVIAQLPETTTIRVHATLDEHGSVRPDEVVRALATISGCSSLGVARIVRESITLRDAEGEAVLPELVGADVPEGPARPWGSC